jgi:hypothetical protein
MLFARNVFFVDEFPFAPLREASIVENRASHAARICFVPFAAFPLVAQ